MRVTTENFMKSETVVLQRAVSGPFIENPPITSTGNSWNMDFNDVFGGPPRQFSMKEAREKYSFGEINLSEDDEASSSPWAVAKEKPVFGPDSAGKRRYPCDDFFDDIFRGEETYHSPRRSDRDRDSSIVSGSAMRIASPVAAKADVLGTSFPAHFSLASKSTTALEFSPRFTSLKQLNSLHSSSSSSRFDHRSPLTSFSSEDSSSTDTSDQRESVDNSKKNNKSMDSPLNCNKFHFSIYKWAGKGIPTLTMLTDRRNFRDTNFNGKLDSEFTRSKSATVKNQNLSTNMESEFMQTDCDEDYRGKEEIRGPPCSAEALEDILESTTTTTTGVIIDVATQDVKLQKVSHDANITEVPIKYELKPLHPPSTDDVQQTGKAIKMKENKSKAPKEQILNVHDCKNVKKNEEAKIYPDTDESSLNGVAVNSSVTPDKRARNGTVKEFVQIFNQDAGPKPKSYTPIQNKSNRWKGRGIDKKEHNMDLNDSKVYLNSAHREPDVSYKVDKNQINDEEGPKSQTKTPCSRKSFHCDPNLSVENSDDPFEDFLVQELSPDDENVTESNKVSEDMKALDAKIRQWSVGKKGNIRSLLSTLQLVLWPEVGWKQVALVDLIEANAVKRAYQKALLRLHPDKLQQNGAGSHEKYIAEKVFDLLQEAWDHFNTLTPL